MTITTNIMIPTPNHNKQKNQKQISIELKTEKKILSIGIEV